MKFPKEVPELVQDQKMALAELRKRSIVFLNTNERTTHGNHARSDSYEDRSVRRREGLLGKGLP
jgi:hypothetical protein